MSTFISKGEEINLLDSDKEEMYRRLIESLKCGVYMADADGNLLYANQAFAEILGYENAQEVVGLNLAKELYIDSEERKLFLRKMEEKGYVRGYVVRNLRKDGSAIVLSAASNFIRNKNGEVVGVEGVITDITEKAQLEESLKIEKRKLEEVLGFGVKACNIKRFDDLIDFIVKKAAEFVGAGKCSLMLIDEDTNELCIKGAKGLSDEMVKNSRLKIGDPIAGIVAQEGVPILVQDIEKDKRFQRKNRDSYSGPSFISVPIKIDNKLIGVINVANKIQQEDKLFNEQDLSILCDLVCEVAVAIENVKLYKELNYLTVTDPLTHMHNFRYFIETLEFEVKRSHRLSSALCLMMIDIDDFNPYNEDYGHSEGDILLKQLSGLLQQNLRQIDITCRYAGDEFVVILPETDQWGARIAAERIRKLVKGLKVKRKITFSIGVAKLTKDMERHEFVIAADRALQQAKREGRDRIFIYT